MATALLLLNGELRSPAAVRALARKADIVVCADGGLRHAVRLKVRPQLVIGDMDSLPRPLPKKKDLSYLCDFDQDLSDFEKALRWLEDAGVREVWVAGALGGRFDHLLANLSIAERYSARIPLAFVDDGVARLAGEGMVSLPARRGQIVSLIPAGERCRLSTKGLRYRLRDEKLVQGSRGLSNTATGSRVEVRVHSGRVWIVSGPRTGSQ